MDAKQSLDRSSPQDDQLKTDETAIGTLGIILIVILVLILLGVIGFSFNA